MSRHLLFIHVNLLAPVESPDTIPLSEATILAHLKNHEFDGQILGDFRNAPLKPQLLAESLHSHAPLALGFTVYQENIEQVRLWARFAKKTSPKIHIVLGGPQVTFMPAEALEHMPEVDFLCRGEGEKVMLDLARALSQGKDPARVPGICLLQDGFPVETGPSYGPRDLDTYGSPYLMDLIDVSKKERAVMLTSRGCVYDCAFCYTPRASQKRVRFYSIDRIIEEMKYLKSKGIEAFWFADTNFSASRKRLVRLLEAIINHLPGITFWCQTRYDLVTPELLSLLRRAGASNIAYGLESANPGVLERINKPIDLKRLSEVIRLTQESGINVELFSMFGLPGETFNQALKTLDFVREHHVAVDGNSISQQAHLFFGTPMNDHPEAYGLHPLPRTRPAYSSVCRDYETDTMSAEEIRRISLIWRVNRNDFAEDVEAGRNLFHRASFLVQNRKALADRPEADALLAKIYLALEEYRAAIHCMQGLKERFPEDQTVGTLLRGPFRCFKISSKASEFGFKVIYDCHGSMGGNPLPATCGRFQEAIIGKGRLLPALEEELEGLGAGEEKAFDITFPNNYGGQSLAGEVVTFRVHVHRVLEPLIVEEYKDLDQEALSNRYALADTDALRRHNINLYYMALQSATQEGWVPPMADILMFMNLYLKLGFVDLAAGLIGKLPQNPVALCHSAHIFCMNGQSEKALELLNGRGAGGLGDQRIRAQALFDLNRLEESEALLKETGNPKDIEIAGLQVALASRLCLPMEVLLQRTERHLDAKIETLLLGESR
jgi:radical SAM superfamily enzyme YgiQ (UPF0313 family)